MIQKLTRRDALALLGATAGVGLASTLRSDAFTQAPTAAARPVFERGAVIRTLLADVPPDRIDGPVLFHEHLSLRYPLTRALAEQQGRPVPASYSDDVDLMIEETKAAGADGVRCIVDGGHPDMDRDLGALRRIATASGVHIVGSGGFYMQRNYPPDIAAKTADQIADELVADARTQRLGALGEIGQQGGVLTDDERRVFTAVAKAQARIGLPIFTHNAYTGTRQVATPVPMDAALKQLDALEAGGANPRHVAIGHVCCLDDVKAEIPKQLAKRGAFVGFDRVTLPIVPDAQKVTTILAFLDAGFVDSLLLSSDFVGLSLKKNGGAGLAQTVTVFGPMLLKAGVNEATLRHILVDNSRRFLAFVPKG
jgi:predicted metal-dependent phosphotriesterase family hydrolase